MSDERKYDLKQLGSQSGYADTPEKAVLEKVPNPHPDTKYLTRFTCPEFTSLCPITNQPDFAFFVIDYVPGKWLLESKSLKLFMFSFRNHGAFHEDCTIYIAKRIIKEIAPEWLRISGYWYPRGGIPIDIFYQTSTPPEDIHIPATDIAIYKGRG